MSEKPGKRLVGWKQYLQIAGKRTILNGSATGLGFCGVGILLLTVFGILRFAIFHQTLRQSMGSFCLGIAMYSGASIGLIQWSRAMFRNAKKLEAVAPITRHNTGDLPAADTLVRASALPPSHQQAELLRGVVAPTSETPPEELLRATSSGAGD